MTNTPEAVERAIKALISDDGDDASLNLQGALDDLRGRHDPKDGGVIARTVERVIAQLENLRAALSTPSSEGGKVAGLRQKLRMVVAHATGGDLNDIDLPINDLCVKISACRNHIYQAGKDAALSTPVESDAGERLPQDVVRLVIAARMVAWEDAEQSSLKELQEASEAFASRVPWEDEPEDAAAAIDAMLAFATPSSEGGEVALRRALVEAAIPLEAAILAGKSPYMSPELWEGIVTGAQAVRDALGTPPAPCTEVESTAGSFNEAGVSCYSGTPPVESDAICDACPWPASAHDCGCCPAGSPTPTSDAHTLANGGERIELGDAPSIPEGAKELGTFLDEFDAASIPEGMVAWAKQVLSTCHSASIPVSCGGMVREEDAVRAMVAFRDAPQAQGQAATRPGIPPAAYDALRQGQRQLDQDGVEVGVSRQALDELLDWYDQAPVPTAHSPSAPEAEVVKRARAFHEAYERLAPQFGYETREETRAFDPASANGQLMIAVMQEIYTPRPTPKPNRDAGAREVSREKQAAAILFKHLNTQNFGGSTVSSGYFKRRDDLCIAAMIEFADAILAQLPSPDSARPAMPMGEEPNVVLDFGGGPIDVDASIAPIVKALNRAGFPTVASCSGHTHRPANIALQDGRELIIARDFAEARMIERLFPVGANGEVISSQVDCPGHVASEHNRKVCARCGIHIDEERPEPSEEIDDD